MKLSLSSTLRLGFVVLATNFSAHGATLTQTVPQSGSFPDGWADVIWGTPAAAPTSGNDYINPNGTSVRTPIAGGTTFGGNSLEISGKLGLIAASGVSSTHTVNDLRLNNGFIGNYGSGNQTQTLAGSITVLNSTTNLSRVGGTDKTRSNQFTALISGGSGATFESYLETADSPAASVSIFTNSANTYSGLWKLTSGTLRFTDLGSVGAGSVIINGGTLQIQNDWLGTGATLTTTAGTISLSNAGTDYNWTVAGLTIGSTSVLGGATYSASQLNTISGGSFGNFTGNGTITVVPEPTSALLVAFGSLALLRRRRV